MAEISLEEFAAQLLALAASPDRVAAAAATVIENPIAVGPLRVGPGRIAKATALCYIGEISGRPASGDWDVVLDVPARIGASVLVRPQRFKFGLDIRVTVRIRLVPTTGPGVTVDIDPIDAADVLTTIDAQHLPAKLVALGYNIEAEVIAKVIEHANAMLVSPEISKARHVDLHDVIDRAWRLGAVLEHRPHTPHVPETFEAPDIDDDTDLSTEEEPETGPAQLQRTLPLELPPHHPHTP